MKILVITYYWPPSGGAGVQRWLKFVRYLPSRGITPVVLTVDPASAVYPVRDPSLSSEVDPSLRVVYTSAFHWFSLYGKFTGKSGVPFGGFANEGNPSFRQKISRFVRGNFLLPDARRGWNRSAFSAACQLLSHEAMDGVVTTGPPHSTHLLGLRLKNRFKIPWVADFRDPWTDIYYYSLLYPSYWALRYDRWLERKVLESADQLITVSKDLKRLLMEKSSRMDVEKIHVIPNGYDGEDFSVVPGPKEPVFTISYTGTLAATYPVVSLVNVLRSLSLDFFLRFYGRVDPGARELLEEGLGERVAFVSHVPHAEAVRALQTSQLLLLIVPDIEKNKGILTGKLFEYIGSGVPVLALGPVDGDASAILQETNSGRMFDYQDEEGIRGYLFFVMSKDFPGLDSDPSAYERKVLTGKLAHLLNGLKKKET